MSETVTCPGCGAPNAAPTDHCKQCNLPLAGVPLDSAATARASEPAPPPPPPPAPVREVSGFDPGPRPVRRTRARAASAPTFHRGIVFAVGLVVVGALAYYAVTGFRQTHFPEVPGANPELQKRADLARRVIEQDSTNVMARIELANVLYDTANWAEAIVHYRSANRLDPQRATTVVDMGVCYFNLGQGAVADSLFQHALTLDPKQVIAIFNLGIVAESQGRNEDALRWFERAIQVGVRPDMKEMVEQRIRDLKGKIGGGN